MRVMRRGEKKVSRAVLSSAPSMTKEGVDDVRKVTEATTISTVDEHVAR